ncbi:unnamed protein product, partial [Cyprideis torosa]
TLSVEEGPRVRPVISPGGNMELTYPERPGQLRCTPLQGWPTPVPGGWLDHPPDSYRIVKDILTFRYRIVKDLKTFREGSNLTLACPVVGKENREVIVHWLRDPNDRCDKKWLDCEVSIAQFPFTLGNRVNIDEFTPNVSRFTRFAAEEYDSLSVKVEHAFRRDLFYIVLGVVGSVYLLLLIPLICLKRWANKKRKEVRKLRNSIKRITVEKGEAQDGAIIIPRVSIDDPELRSYAKIERQYIMDPDPIWEMDRECLQLGCLVDEGAFEKVYKADIRSQESQYPRVTVACETLKDTHCDSDVLDVVRELEVMKAVGKHQNIINNFWSLHSRHRASFRCRYPSGSPGDTAGHPHFTVA